MSEEAYTITAKELKKLTRSNGTSITLAVEPITVSPGTAAELMGISRTMVYELIGRADFPQFSVGSRRLIPVRELRDWAAAQVEGQKEAAPVLEHRSGRAEQSLTCTVSASSLHKSRGRCQV